MSESSQKSAARVKLILDQCLQKKRLQRFIFIAKNMLLQCYSDVSSSEKRIKKLT